MGLELRLRVSWLLEWRAQREAGLQSSDNLPLLAVEGVTGQCHQVLPWLGELTPIGPSLFFFFSSFGGFQTQLVQVLQKLTWLLLLLTFKSADDVLLA
ncbi:hypothetical protein O6P43_001230 [Quillaja saponaria]|uniref:Uncharacterized protein n=1 Tax=Quillaja saponaria TaxID=32244 RepID=A0AAD7VNI7_QUISA|nr:hypothetical protein O6P43_001230 [Quillaja saponaria]